MTALMHHLLDPIRARLFEGRITGLHVLIVLLSFTVSLSAWQYSKTVTERRSEARFHDARDQTIRLIKERLEKYEDALWAGVSAIDSHGSDISHKNWRIFAHNLRIEDRYPGINGIGVIHFVADKDMPRYLASRLAERPDFSVHPARNAETYLPISFIEPEEINKNAIGLDVAHELNRRKAALKSRDTGTAQISGPIILVQDASSTPGFLFYAPVYRGAPPTTVAERRQNIVSAVYAPFVVSNLVDGLLAKDLRNVGISIRDDGITIYDEHLLNEDLHDYDPMFVDHVDLDVYGRTWQIDIRSNLAFRVDNTANQPTIILLAGLLIEMLIITMFITMARANRKAIIYAKQATVALRAERGRLVRSNEELERFAYATSHDLKTPVRGIGGLAEMLKDDLEDYLALPNANSDVAVHIGLIEDRVGRMTDLIDGILEYSQVGKQTIAPPLDLEELIVSLRTDLDLQPGQLILGCDQPIVEIDPINCRRVLENLIGNAVKHHDEKTPLIITVTARSRGNFIDFAVADNGPGIDPAYQKKVFEMFQALRSETVAESTGIGLAIAKKAVQFHGGELKLHSALGRGSEFSFNWPQSVDQENQRIAA